MRILVVSNLYPPVVRGGYEVECSGVVEQLRARGDDVLVLTSSLQRERARSDEHDVRRELTFLSPDARGALRAPAASLRDARVTRRALGQFVPELVYVWNGSQIPQATLSILAASGTPLAYRVCEHWFGRLWSEDQFMRHLSGDDRGLRRAWAGLVGAVNSLPSLRLDPRAIHPAAVCWNSETIRRLAGTPPPVRPVLERTIHSTSLHARRFEQLERRPSAHPSVAFLGRLSSEKGADVAVRALGALEREHGVRAELVLAGPGEEGERRRLQALASAEGVADRLRLLGPLDEDGMASLLAGAHALVIPSVWEDPFPLVCIEGALARVPVVASDIGGIPECLHDREHALLFAPGDAEACAVALAELLGDPEQTAARVERAFARGREFSYDGYLRASLQFVDDARAALSEL